MSNTAAVAIDSSGKYLSHILIETKKGTTKSVRASSDTVSRCREILTGLREFVAGFLGQPILVFAETPSGSQSAAGMKSYGISCAVIATVDPPAIEVTPHEVKVAATGNKSASKADMIAWAVSEYPELPWPMRGGKPMNKCEHLADALAVIKAGTKTEQYHRIMTALHLI